MTESKTPRAWNDGWRCNECCNGDRCDDPSHYDRARCPHCKGTGLALWNMYAKEAEFKKVKADLASALAAKERAEAQLASQDDERIALAAKLSELKDAACRFRDLYYATVQERDALAAKLAEAERLQLKQSTPPIVRYTLDISDGRMVKSPDGFWASAYELAAAYTTIATLTSKLAEAEKDAGRLQAIAKHGWYIVQDIEGDWQVKSPRRYGAPVMVAEAMSLHLAIDAAISQERSDA